MSSARSDLRRRGLGLLGIAVMLGGCRLTIEPPESFILLQTHASEIKATTADDALLWVRDFVEPEVGDLAFWAAVLHHDLLERGYRPVGEPTAIRDGAGRTGEIRSYETQLAGRAHGYLVALFVDPGSSSTTIRVAEFVAAKPRFDELLPRVRASLETLRG